MGTDAHSSPEATPPDETEPALVARPVDVRLLVAALSVGTGLLLIVNLVLKAVSTPEEPAPFVGLFDVNHEMNVPTVWNAALLIGAGATFLLVSALTERRRVGWVLAALAAGAMAVDELLRFHEQLRSVGVWLNGAIGVSLPTYTWVLPGIVIAAAGIAVLWVWTARHPSPSGLQLRIAVLMYGGGAVGVEAVSGWVEGRFGYEGFGPYALITAVEEGLEMLACVVAIVAALRMLRSVDLPVGRRAFFAPHDARKAVSSGAR